MHTVIAVMRDPTKMVAMTRMGGSSNAKQPIQIFSSSGDLITTVTVSNI